MCGIAGRVNFDRSRPVSERDVRVLADAISHRGPDDHGVHVDGNVGLSHRRLSIIDLSVAGHQPMSWADERYWITYNGEIYNFRELRKELEADGVTFRSNSDTEVLLALFARDGHNCLLKLRGMYGFAVWDSVERVLFVVRDPLGIKPVYFYQDREKFVFASEIKAILAAPDVPREIDPVGMQNFFAHGHGTAPVTIYKNVRKLLPGHWIEVRDDSVRIEQFWNPQPGPDRDSSAPPWDDQVAQLTHLLRDSVDAHLISDVPLGVFLSGGMDSSAIVSLMALNGSSKIKTFSIGFDFGQRYNELDDARVVADHFNTDHHELVLREEDLQDSLEDIVYHYDEPFGDPAAFPTYFVSRLAREHVTVCLSGEGSDELFGGYNRYLAERYGSAFRVMPARLRRVLINELISRVPRSYRLKQLSRVLDISDPVRRQGNWQMMFTDDMRSQLFAPGMLNGVDPAEVYESFRRHRAGDGSDGMNGVLFADLRSWLADRYLEKADKASMAHSLEARVPLLDLPVVDYGLQLPIDSKARYTLSRRDNNLKRILAATLVDRLPSSILNKPKQGFAVPLDPWFRGKLSPFIAEILLDESTRRRGYFDAEYVERLFRQHSSGREVWNKQLWLMVMFELWCRRFLDR